MSAKIVWGFDAFEDGFKTSISVAETLSSLNAKLKGSVQPLFTLGAEVSDPAPAFESEAIGELTKATEARMEVLREKVNIPGVLPPKVIFERSFSRTKVVKRFIAEAEKAGANLIVVGAHGKKGLERMVLGSFAETLLLHCHLPVLVVGQNFDQIPHWNEILFPTDFSEDSHFAFQRVLELARVLGSRVTLYHHISPLLGPVIQSTIAPFGGVWPTYQSDMQILRERKQVKLNEWAKNAENSNVEISKVLDTNETDSSEAILSYAKANKIGLITMATQSGTLATTLFGAITRKVVRQAQCPVWLLRRSLPGPLRA